MKPETEEWIEKAEGDRKVAQREMQTAEAVYDVVCFLSLQCVAKYLKAFLEEHGIYFSKTHDLVELLDSRRGMLAELDEERECLGDLSEFGIAARYPGIWADRSQAEDATRTAEAVRTVVREPGTALIQECREQGHAEVGVSGPEH